MKNKKSREVMIVEKAVALFKEKGVKNVTILEICEELGITRSSFYYYFKSKEEVFDYYFLSSEIEITEHLMPLLTSKSSYEQFTHIFSVYMERTTQWGPEIFGHIVNRYVEGKNAMLSPRDIAMGDVYISLLRRAQENKEIKNTAPTEELVETIVYLSVGLAVDWCNQNGSFDYSLKLRETIDSILQPIDYE
ncbi:MAG TPA: TetR/AcrR family transcriptional regulator [Epulopiscium sp.]|nr:TetR/AcrR family transcriptional regulator [Candidatus Epulonipiscium sp.]